MNSMAPLPRRARPRTRRGRIERRRAVAVVALATWVALLVAGVAGSSGAQSASSPMRARVGETVLVAERSYVVEPGDTLWGIARRISRGGDPRPVVEEIILLNGLGDSPLAVGRRLRLP